MNYSENRAIQSHELKAIVT